MRTTLTLDDHIASRLHQIARERGVSFKDVVHEAMQVYLAGGVPQPRRFRMPTSDLGGVRPGIDLDKALQLAADLEDDEILRKMDLRK